jgi:CRISPR-associated endonuclease/helicase Cas3
MNPVDSDPQQALANVLELSGPELLFPWQKRLLYRFSIGDLPKAIDIPTGLGKTSVMAIWLIARAYAAKLPRRLVYVVNRRAVVDQATDEAERLQKFVEANPGTKAGLGLGSKMLPVSTLRGQLVDNREWLEDPSMPAILVGTVDMIGSRLLFEGYRLSRKMRPYHAGLLGADTLVVLDEAHLVPPFESLLDAIARPTAEFGPADEELKKVVPSFKLLTLSATGRNSGGNCHGVEKDDSEHDVVRKRLNAPKRLVLKPLTEAVNAEGAQQNLQNYQIAGDPNAPTEARVGEKPSTNEKKKQAKDNLVEALAREAWELAHNEKKPLRILVFCDERQVAQKVEATLRKLATGDQKSGQAKAEIEEPELFVGGRRVFEREKAKERLKELGFLAGSKVARTKSTFLIATSAAEVGVDLDADHMVCDLVPWERMVQRLGRVNRRGDGDATVIVVVQPEPKNVEDLLKKPAQDLSLKETKAVECFKRLRAVAQALNKLPAIHGGRNASPGALRQLKEEAEKDSELKRLLDAAVTPAPLRPPLTRALVDAWSMTSLETHTGRPAIDPWLRGWLEDDPPQTAVVWRTHLPASSGRQPTKKEIEPFFEAAPPHTSELLETETHRVIDWLGKRGLALLDRATKGEEGLPGKDDVVAFVLARDLTLRRRPITLGELVTSHDKKNEKEELESALEGATLVVDARLAGLKTGLLENDENTLPPIADGENWLAEGVGFRVRSVAAGESVVTDSKWHERRRFAAEVSSEGEPLRWLIIEKWRDDATTEDDRSTSRPQLLDEHQSWAERRARAIATRLGLGKEYVEMLAAAALVHDEGKRAKRWQRAFNAPAGGDYAKTEGPINFALLDGYRHEFGSLLRLGGNERLKALPEELRELALHLIAAHHGFGRPIISTSGCEDAPPDAPVLQERAREVALRFARLQRRWGLWGLAWWESLLRAADQQASRENEETVSPTEAEVRHG